MKNVMKELISRIRGRRKSHSPPQGLRPRRKGIALVMVLAVIVLILVVVLAFMASITMERQSASSYASGMESRMLAESAVNLAMGQVRAATEQDGVVWTSQPGLLRTFNASGTPLQVYKLYSSPSLVESGASFDPVNDVPAGWAADPATFVDLNRPVVTPVNGTMRTNYPILDPRGIGKIEGFSTNNSPYGVSMPVQWIYVLENGTLTNATGLTKANPPVARFAFWTDDETSKLNINTASEGSFWDVPKTGTADDRRMALNQPAQREFQAYPGHPATTSLSPVLWNYFRTNSSMTLTNSASTTNTFPEILYSMLPRTQGGGSRGGTTRLANTNGALPYKNDRLFTSVDELAFLPPSTNSATTERQPNPYIDRETLEQTRFFLTAQSSAPELNLFNQPRVTIWPEAVQTDALHRTPFDNLIAFASTINGSPYYFTRSDPNSPTADFSGRNVQLYQYLQNLTGQQVPGFGGGTFAAKYPTDRDQILTEIFDYVRSANPVDTSSGLANFQTYTTNAFNEGTGWIGQNAIYPEPGMGQVVPISPTSGSGAGTRGFGRFDTINRAIFVLGAVTNIVDTNSVPNVTNATVTEAALFFEAFNPAMGQSMYCPDYQVEVTTSGFTAASGPGFTNNTSIQISGTNIINVPHSLLVSDKGKNVGGYEGFGASLVYGWGQPKIPGATGSANYPFVSQRFTNTWNSTNNPTVRLNLGRITAQIRAYGNVVQTLNIDFPTGDLIVPMPVPITTNSPAAAANPINYTDGLVSRFENSPFNSQYDNGPGAFQRNGHSRGAHQDHWITANGGPNSPGDFARSAEVTGVNGDLRLVAAKASVGNEFEPVAGYSSSSNRVFSAMPALGSIVDFGYILWGSTNNGNLGFGKLLQNAQSDLTFGTWFSPIPPGINGVTNVSGGQGDWDTGIGTYPNGPYINKPDDGNPPKSQVVSFVPYISHQDQYVLSPGQTFSSPSRQIPSAVYFGSLPTGVNAGDPWQTLLFCPNPASLYGANPSAHKGSQTPEDHLLLDLFHLPVVEPYAISEPFSTAGKVNMNYQIIPFTGIERKTALYGVLRPVKITAINDSSGSGYTYKTYNPANSTPLTFRYPIEIPKTLNAFDDRFATNGVFRSASEICDIFLIPDPSLPATPPYPWTTPVSMGNIAAFWQFHALTGDNARENPYALIYPRLTTRSNTYTVHVWAQTLKKIPGTDPTKWVEGRDVVTGEFRGSYLIERYLHPADSDIPDYATASTPKNLNQFYRFRVINAKQFNP